MNRRKNYANWNVSEKFFNFPVVTKIYRFVFPKLTSTESWFKKNKSLKWILEIEKNMQLNGNIYEKWYSNFCKERTRDKKVTRGGGWTVVESIAARRKVQRQREQVRRLCKVVAWAKKNAGLALSLPSYNIIARDNPSLLLLILPPSYFVNEQELYRVVIQRELNRVLINR